MMEIREGQENPPSFAVLGCPDTTSYTATNICGADKTDAETKAPDAAKGHYACTPPCDLNIITVAGAPGGQCWVNNQPPWTPGRLYDVKVTVTCS